MRQRHELEEEAEDSEVELTSAAAAANVIAKLSARIDSVQTEVKGDGDKDLPGVVFFWWGEGGRNGSRGAVGDEAKT